MALIGTDIDLAKNILTEGDLVGIPTETVYGLAGNAFNLSAVTKIFEVKNRPFFDPLIVHTYAWSEAATFCTDIPAGAHQLADACWPGPLTLLLKRKPIIPDLVTAGRDRVALRIPEHETALSLLSQLDFPLAAPSANPFGYLSPTTPQHVNDQLGGQIPYILDGGPCQVGIESTIIGFDEQEQPELYRLGGMGIDEIEAIVGQVKIAAPIHSDPEAPGMLEKHYAPKKLFTVGEIESLLKDYDPDEIALLTWNKTYPQIKPDRQIILSEAGDLGEAAQKLFAALRQLDEMPVKGILAEWVPDQGLGKAINDRLRRASVR